MWGAFVPALNTLLGEAQRRRTGSIHGLGDVDALVALESDEFAAGLGGQDLGDLRLADTRLPFQQQWATQLGRQEYGGCQAPIGEVAVAGEGLGDRVDRGQLGVRARHDAHDT